MEREKLERENIGEGIGSAEKIVESIKQEAEEEARKILLEAREYLKRKIEQAEDDARKLISEAENGARMEADSIIENALVDARIEISGKILNSRKEIYDSVLEKAKKILENSLNSAEYRDAMRYWVFEGILVLGTESVVVSSSESEKEIFDNGFIKDLKSLVREKTGREIEVKINTNSYLDKQGVVIETPDKRLSYNNTLESRLSRLSEKIKDIIYKRVLVDLE